MNNISSLNLSYNPYMDLTPSINNDRLIWAEMQEVKSKIERTYSDCINNNSKQLVLNWGAYGGGKTFSAYYFIREKSDIDDLHHIYVRCPKDGAKAADEFFKNIIDFISFEKLQAHIRFLIANNGESLLMQFLTPITGREYSKAICLIGSEDSDVSDTMNRFLYAGLTKTELKKLGLAKDIQTDTDSIKFLAGIISCFIGDGNFYNGKVVFWIDEMEDLIYYSSKHYKGFSQVLRDLFDSISNGFLMFMNFTLAEGEESTIELILGGAVWSRLTKKIRYKQFLLDNALAYSIELLKHAKIDLNNNSPLCEEIIRLVLQQIPLNNLTPREINKHLRSLLSFAIESEVSNIDLNIANKWITEYAEDN